VSDPGSVLRARLLTAMTHTVALHGYREASVAEVCARAGVQLGVFDELFLDREDCCLAAYDEVVKHVSVRVLVACRGAESWEQSVREAMRAVLAFCEQQPLAARFALVESAGVSTRMLWRRSRLMAHLADLVHQRGCVAACAQASPPALARAALDRAHSIVHESVVNAGSARLVDLTAPLASMIVLPYTGEQAASRELARAQDA
jgi:AcrR family transcriptional regulator